MTIRLRHAPPARSSAGRRGQTLAEFAISLPILLLLLLGILEFGRLFQSWVTIQNAARSAARYAVTGAYNEEKYDLEALLPCVADRPPNSVIKTTYDVPIYAGENLANTNRSIDILSDTTLPVDNEYIYLSWYGVLDCIPNDDSLQERKDILRLPSIYDAARQGAAGIILDPSLTGDDTPLDRPTLFNFLANYWENPSPDQATRGWFNVMICSERGRLQPTNRTIITGNPDGNNQRYFGFTDGNPHDVSVDNPDAEMMGGGCLLKERPYNVNDAEYMTLSNADQLAVAQMPDNHNENWADAGSAGERITIVITYNHPLITPLGLAEFIQIQARRSAVNESFRVTNADIEQPPCCTGIGNLPTLTPPPPTETLTPSNTPIDTDTPSPSPTASPTETPKPFSCSLISATGLFFDTQQTAIVVRFFNGNLEDTEYTHVTLKWDPAQMLALHSNAYFGFSSIDSDVHWQGDISANISPLDSLDTTRGDSLLHDAPPILSNDPFDPNNDDLYNPNAYRTVPGGGSSQWKGNFVNVSGMLINAQDPWDFGGTIFYFRNLAFDDDPTQPRECAIELEAPDAPPAPTDLPPGFVASATFTPDCADNRLKLEFVRFDPAGDVRLRVTNQRPIPGYFTGFTINWPAAKIAGLRFSRVVVGGANANDIPDPLNNPGGTGRVVWSHPTGATTSPTNSANSGTWQAGAANANYYVFPPNSITDVHLDFTGAGPSTLSALGAHASDFNGTSLRIWCTPTGNGGGGGGGGGGGQGGDITFGLVATPGPTSVPPPTKTVGPTLTPSKTPTPGPPTKTWTPAPPTNTQPPTPTAQATNTPTRTPSPTPRDLGGADG